MKFKDQCDICNQFKYLKGYNNYCICEDCKNRMIERELSEAKQIAVKGKKVTTFCNKYMQLKLF